MSFIVFQRKIHEAFGSYILVLKLIFILLFVVYSLVNF